MYNAEYGAVIGRETRLFVCAQLQFPGYGVFKSQSRRRILRCTSNHEILPNDSVNYSG